MPQLITEIFPLIPETLKLPAKLLYYMGWFQSRTLKTIWFQIASFLILSNLIVIGIIQFANLSEVSQFVINLEGVFALIQASGKMLVFFYYHTDIARLLEMTREFWDAENHSKEAENDQVSKRKLLIKLENIFLCLITLCCVFMTLIAYFENVSIIGVWTLEGYKQLFFFIQMEQLMFLLIGIVFVWTIDCLFLGLCIEIMMQFKLMSCYLKELGGRHDDSYHNIEEAYRSKIKCIIHHHLYIIGFFKQFQQIFSFILFIEYVTDAPLILAELFATQESKSKEIQLRHFLLCTAVIIQLGFHCIPANYVSYEASEVANAAYFSDWEAQTLTPLRTTLVLIIQNSQNGIVMKAGGLITMNAGTLIDILKVAWSASSIMRGLKS